MSGSKVVRYRRRPKSALIIFTLVLIYIICFGVIYISKSKVQTYEVNTGSLTNNASFTAFAIRNERIFNASYSGNINYYQREGTRIKTGDTVYTIDETGRVAEILSTYHVEGENSLSADNLAEIRSTLNQYKTNYDNGQFSAIYDLKSDLNTTVLQSINESIMANLESIVANTGSENLFQTISSEAAGIVVYSVDGYENMSEEDITKECFKKDKYTKNDLKSESNIVKDSPAYKVVTSENWNLYIELSDKDIETYGLSSKKYITIKIKKDNISATCNFDIIKNGDSSYGKITLNKYMIRYATERYLDIEIVTSGKSGMKIPVSAVVENEFYIIPKDYVIYKDYNSSPALIVNTYNESNKLTTVTKDIEIYKSIEDKVYISKSDISPGTVLLKENSTEQFIIGPTDKLKGVYCVNTGYTVFKLIEIIDANNEYYIVKQNIPHGISIYDRIVLDAEKYTENEMIY